jgi:hypothetical protein
MHAVKVTFENGDTITTEINGTRESISEYYAIGKVFNLGRVSDNLQRVTNIQFI